jgi:hypothetical protein
MRQRTLDESHPALVQNFLSWNRRNRLHIYPTGNGRVCFEPFSCYDTTWAKFSFTPAQALRIAALLRNPKVMRRAITSPDNGQFQIIEVNGTQRVTVLYAKDCASDERDLNGLGRCRIARAIERVVRYVRVNNLRRRGRPRTASGPRQ